MVVAVEEATPTFSWRREMITGRHLTLLAERRLRSQIIEFKLLNFHKSAQLLCTRAEIVKLRLLKSLAKGNYFDY